MSSAQKNFGVILLQIALALFLVVSGIAVLQGGNGGDVGVAVNSIIKGDIARIVVYAIGVCELLAGVFLIIRFFMPTGNLAAIWPRTTWKTTSPPPTWRTCSPIGGSAQA